MLRTLLITGASTGIGEACALAFDREGWRVFAGVRRDADGAKLTAQASDRLRVVRLDVSDATSIANAVRDVEMALEGKGLDGLVNNAGISVGGPLEFVPLELVRRQFDVNVFGLLAVTQAFLPLLRRARGRIVNIGSIAGRVPSPLVGPYTASKHAVEAITDVLRLELSPWRLHVAVIEPGAVATPIWEKGQAQLAAREADLAPAARERYGPLLAALGQVVRGAAARGAPPSRVVDAVRHALNAGTPRTRYVVGRDARMRLLLQTILPRRWMDAVILAYLRRLSRRTA